MGCDAVSPGYWFPTFRSTVMHSSLQVTDSKFSLAWFLSRHSEIPTAIMSLLTLPIWFLLHSESENENWSRSGLPTRNSKFSSSLTHV